MNRVMLESFDRSLAERLEDTEDAAIVERLKAEAFEAGYASGWEDAIASDKTARMQLEAEFERNIQNIAFSFGEAVTQVRGELRDFLAALIEQFLPAIAPEVLREHVRTELLTIGENLTDVPIEVVTSPDCNSTVAEMLSTDFAMDIHLVEDASLSAGQVYLRLGTREVEVTLEPLMRAVSCQLAALKDPPEPKGDRDVGDG